MLEATKHVHFLREDARKLDRTVVVELYKFDCYIEAAPDWKECVCRHFDLELGSQRQISDRLAKAYFEYTGDWHKRLPLRYLRPSFAEDYSNETLKTYMGLYGLNSYKEIQKTCFKDWLAAGRPESKAQLDDWRNTSSDVKRAAAVAAGFDGADPPAYKELAVYKKYKYVSSEVRRVLRRLDIELPESPSEDREGAQTAADILEAVVYFLSCDADKKVTPSELAIQLRRHKE